MTSICPSSCAIRSFACGTLAQGKVIQPRIILYSPSHALIHVPVRTSALNAALAEYVKLVPDAFHRAFYLRLFKWTVAFATWHRPDPALEEIKKIIGDTSEEVHVPAEEARGTARQQQRGRSPSPVRSLSGTFSAYSTTTGRKKKPGLAQVIQRTLRQQNRGPSFTSSPPPRSPSPPKGVGSPSNYIPFSQRQAKSEVAAREMLKKGKEHNFRKFEHHTDNLIHESLSNLKR